VDEIYLGFLNPAEKLSGVGRKTLHITPLSFSVEGVKSKRGFSGTTQPGNHHKPVAGDIQRDVFQVVDPGAANDDIWVGIQIDIFYKNSKRASHL